MATSADLTFYGGWAGLIAVGAAYWYVQKQRELAKTGRAVAAKSLRAEGRREKTRKPRTETPVGDDKKRKPRKADAPEITFASTEDDRDDDDVDNREFARQLSHAKAGTNLTTKPKNAQKQKSVKQSRAKNQPFLGIDETSSNAASVPSSTTGADADDDLSATTSPDLPAAAENGDISDMLETRPAGPSVLRLTEPTQPVKQKTKPAPKKEVVETKKQRQNRKKTEAAKAAREEAEEERKVLMEQQRRTARLAEGRVAKDGSAFMASAAAASAWTAKTENAKPVQLLDTFEQAKPAPKQWQEQLPSEEEQMRLLEKETEEASWSTVTSKKSRKAADTEKETTSDKKMSSKNPFEDIHDEWQEVKDGEWEVA